MKQKEESLLTRLANEREKAKSQAELVNLAKYLGYTLAPTAISFIATSNTTMLEKGLMVAGVMSPKLSSTKF